MYRPFLSSQRHFQVPLGYPPQNGLKRCSTGKMNSQILFSLASFLLMSSYSCKRMSRDQIQKQPTVRVSLLVGTRRCHVCTCTKHRTRARTHTHTHTQSRARAYALIHKPNTHARVLTHSRAHVHTTHSHTHTHDYTISDRSLSPSLRHTRSFQGTIHVSP